MSADADFLVEIGTEELPPKALKDLMQAFGRTLEAAVDEARLAHGPVHAYASPRRLSVLIEALAPGGGYVFNSIHNIQADVPPQNLIAMWEALQEYGVY